MECKNSIVLVFSFFLLFGCSNDQRKPFVDLPQPEYYYNFDYLSISENMPYIGEFAEMKIENVDIFKKAPEYFMWTFAETPENIMPPELIIENNGKNVKFLAPVEWEYSLYLSDGNNVRMEKISVLYKIPYDKNKVEKISENSFYIRNQFLFWVDLEKEKIWEILQKYPHLKLLYYKKNSENTPPFLVYIELFDEDWQESYQQLEKFKNETWIIEFLGERFENNISLWE